MEKAYLYKDLEMYGIDYPYCFTEEEAIKIWKFHLKDYGKEAIEFPFDEMFVEATKDEIEDLGFGI